MTGHNAIRLGAMLLLGALLLPAVGCKKMELPDLSNRPNSAEGLGINAPPTKPVPQQPQQVTPPKIDPTEPARTIDKTPNFGVPRPDLLTQSRVYLLEIGRAYKVAALTGIVNGPKELGLPDKYLKDPVGRPYVICFGVDVSNMPGNTLLAWEAGPDSANNRRVVTVGGDVNPISEADFAKAPKAK